VSSQPAIPGKWPPEHTGPDIVIGLGKALTEKFEVVYAEKDKRGALATPWSIWSGEFNRKLRAQLVFAEEQEDDESAFTLKVTFNYWRILTRRLELHAGRIPDVVFVRGKKPYLQKAEILKAQHRYRCAFEKGDLSKFKKVSLSLASYIG